MLSAAIFILAVVGIIELFNCMVFGWEEIE